MFQDSYTITMSPPPKKADAHTKWVEVFSFNLRRLMKLTGKKYEDIQRETGINPATLSSFANARDTNPQFKTIVALAETFGVSPVEFFAVTDSKQLEQFLTFSEWAWSKFFNVIRDLPGMDASDDEDFKARFFAFLTLAHPKDRTLSEEDKESIWNDRPENFYGKRIS